MAELLNPTNDYVFKRLFSDSPDLLAKDEQGGQYNIEIQAYRFQNWYQRSLYYLSRMMATQPQVSMGNLLQLNLLELAKASRLGAAEGALRNWISFFKRWREDWEMSNIEHKPVLAAMDRLRALSQDEEER